MQAFVIQDALGVIAVDNVPGLLPSRAALLPLAAQLAHLDQSQQQLLECPDAGFTVGWCRGRERLRGGEPDRLRGSFFADPLGNGHQTGLPQLGGTDSLNTGPSSCAALSSNAPRGWSCMTCRRQ